MALDSNGIWQYTEQDSEATASDLLNLGMGSVSGRVSDLQAAIDSKQNDLGDTGWVSLTWENDFTNYAPESTPRVRRIGDVVYLTGAGQPGVTGIGFVSSTLMFVLPGGFEPTGYNRIYVCQGTEYARWTMQVETGGNVQFARYSDGSTNGVTGAGNWLPFDVSWAI